MKITRIPRARDKHKKLVAAYCRVSTTLENQEESYETQLNYYTNYIKSNPEWEFAGVYSDEKSGTQAENRPGFQEMIRKALKGKIDYILVKSVSRFSRNMVDCQKYVDMLKGNGVYVRFEKENIDTEDPHSTMMFSFLSAISQDESHSISENVKWSNQKRIQKGEYNLGNNRVFGYDSENGKLIPNENASAVREIYRLFLDGRSLFQIAAAMEAAGVRGRSGKPLTPTGIMYILENEVYTGDKLLQKQAPKNFLTKKPEKGAEYESKYLTDDHEPIVDRSTWQKAQELLKARREEPDSGRVKYSSGRTHFLYGKVVCGDCGSLMTRRTLRSTGKKTCKDNYKAWTCKERHKGRKGNGCMMRNIREADLLAEFVAQIGCADTAVEQKMDSIDRVIVYQDAVEVQRRG